MDDFEYIALAAAIADQRNQAAAAAHARRFRRSIDPFQNLSDVEFIRRFRLSKQLTRDLIELVRPYIQQSPRSSSISVEKKVLITLNFYAKGGYQQNVGDNLHMAVSRPSVCRAISEVTNALNEPEIFRAWVKFPTTFAGLDQTRQKFYNKFCVPGVIGCIDCTHIAIVPPTQNDINPEHIYINRKNFHSINTQLICDSELRILHVNARFPGSTHDSYILNSSNVKPFLSNLFNDGHTGYYLLGDSGYPLRGWLLTPVYDPQTEAESDYNNKHKRVRSVIERCNGLLKMRFRCLLKDRVLHYIPHKPSQIINACCVLHNMCIQHNINLDLDEEEVHIDEEDLFENVPIDLEARGNPDLQAGQRMRQQIINILHQ